MEDHQWHDIQKVFEENRFTASKYINASTARLRRGRKCMDRVSFRETYLSLFVQLLADSGPLAIVVNKLEAVGIRWLLAFKTRR
jgi:hypothetical protein